MYLVLHHMLILRVFVFSGTRPSAWPPICIYRPWPPICVYRPWPPICIYRPWSPICFYRLWSQICIYRPWSTILLPVQDLSFAYTDLVSSICVFIYDPRLRYIIPVQGLDLHLPYYW